MKYVAAIFLVFSLLPIGSSCQRSSYYTCEQGISLSQNNFYHLAFQSKKGIDKSGLNGYAGEDEVSKNQIWLFFDPPFSGLITLKIRNTKSSFNTFIFGQEKDNICTDFSKRNAKLLLQEGDKNRLQKTNVYVEEGLRYAIVFVGDEKISDSLELNIDFKPQDLNGNEIIDSLIFDLTTPSRDKKFALHIRNSQSKKPVKGKISFNGSNEIDGAYVASDLIMNLKRDIKECELKVDAEGFLSFDQEDYKILLGEKGLSDTIYLKPLVRGTVAKIDEIYFAAGLPTILEESAPKLNRLRDFLLVNSTVHIEIQGHVNGDGTKSLKSKRLSKKRAKSILSYLINAGISSDRLSARGFGFTSPVYAKPKNEMEKEANRRVEILIK